FECPDIGGGGVCVCQVVPGCEQCDDASNDIMDDDGDVGEPPPGRVVRSIRRYVPPPGDDEPPEVIGPGDDDVTGVEDQEIATHRTRYLRLGNGTKKRVTFYIRYHARDDDGQLDWFPGQEEDPLIITVEAGQVMDVYDGTWHVNADRVFVWAET